MKKLAIILTATLLIPFCVSAQLGKQMAKYHKKAGISVTQLDKSLYGLYQNGPLPPEMQEMLQKLDEINILNIDPTRCKPEEGEKILLQFRNLLENKNDYRLIKSNTDAESEQLIYARNEADKVTDLIVWNRSPRQTDLIELRGEIQADRIALLPRALNVRGLEALAILSPSAPKPSVGDLDLGGMMQSFEKMMGGLFGGFDSELLSGMEQRLKKAFPTAIDSTGNLNLSDMLSSDHMETVEQLFQSFEGDGNVSSSSVQIIEENGKTRLNVNSENSDITYIIDGIEAPKDNVQLPEKIRNVKLIPSPKESKKSYLLVFSQKPLGTFTSHKDGMLCFRYNNQDYTYNLAKSQRPLLLIDGRLSSTFDIDPSSILQIRPHSQAEKEAGHYPHAEVIINTK